MQFNSLTAHTVFWLGITCLTGCGGGSDVENDKNTLSLLDMVDSSQTRHDPKNFEEVDLGNFFITRTNQYHKPVTVRFHLYGVVPTDEKEEFEESLAMYKKTLRDQIITKMKEAEMEYFNDPQLEWVRSHLRPILNHTLKSRALRDLVFDSIELEEPYGSGAPTKKDPTPSADETTIKG